MLSPSDTIIIFAAALLLFGPEHLPRIAKQLGDAMRHVQNTTHSFMQEMDRAAAAAEAKPAPLIQPEMLPDTMAPAYDEAGAVETVETADSAEKPSTASTPPTPSTPSPG